MFPFQIPSVGDDDPIALSTPSTRFYLIFWFAPHLKGYSRFFLELCHPHTQCLAVLASSGPDRPSFLPWQAPLVEFSTSEVSEPDWRLASDFDLL